MTLVGLVAGVEEGVIIDVVRAVNNVLEDDVERFIYLADTVAGIGGVDMDGWSMQQQEESDCSNSNVMDAILRELKAGALKPPFS